jgi:hypothetical protein
VHQRISGFHEAAEFGKLRGIDGQCITEGNGFYLDGVAQVNGCRIVAGYFNYRTLECYWLLKTECIDQKDSCNNNDGQQCEIQQTFHDDGD